MKLLRDADPRTPVRLSTGPQYFIVEITPAPNLVFDPTELAPPLYGTPTTAGNVLVRYSQ